MTARRNPALAALHRYLLLEEARASVALDHDDRAQTITLDEMTPEERAKWEKK